MKNSKKTTVSIIIPCYNAENYISKLLDSVFDQTFKDFEVICVNDGSTDNTLMLLQEYKNNHSNMLVITKKNEGGKNVTQTGLKFINGKYVCVVDNDDYLDKDYLLNLYNTIHNEDADVSVCAFQREDYSTGKVFSVEMRKNYNVLKIKDDYGKLLEVNTSLWNKMFKKDIILTILDFKLDSLGLGDMTLLAYMYTKIRKIAFTDKVLYYYQVREGSNINNINENVIDTIYDNLIRIKNYYKNSNKEMCEFLDSYAFLHLGVSLMYRVFRAHDGNFNNIYKKNLNILNNNFETWKSSKYYSLRYIMKNKTNIKLFICKIFYKMHLFKIFIKTYDFLTSHMKFDIKW